jgi:hypothetical protein
VGLEHTEDARWPTQEGGRWAQNSTTVEKTENRTLGRKAGSDEGGGGGHCREGGKLPLLAILNNISKRSKSGMPPRAVTGKGAQGTAFVIFRKKAANWNRRSLHRCISAGTNRARNRLGPIVYRHHSPPRPPACARAWGSLTEQGLTMEKKSLEVAEGSGRWIWGWRSKIFG